MLRAAINRAEQDGLVGRNVAGLVKLPAAERRRRPRAFTLEQVRNLLAAAAADPWWNAYCHVAITCGLRPGELLGLSWEDVDLETGTLRVRQSLKAAPGHEPVLARLKTEQSRRSLELPTAVKAALDAHRKAQREERMRLGPAWQEHGLVFPGRSGGPCPRSSARYGFTTLCERAGLGKGWSRYDTRHTWVSHLSDRGVDIEVIADAAGHANSNVTRTVYRHSLADRISATAIVWDQILPA